MVLIETAIIMVGLCVVAWILSQADVKITINHKNEITSTHKEVTPNTILVPDDPARIAEIQKILDEERDKQDVATFDNVVKEVQNILGGDYGE